MKDLTVKRLKELIASLNDDDTVGIVHDEEYLYMEGSGTEIQRKEDTGLSVNHLMISMIKE